MNAIRNGIEIRGTETIGCDVLVAGSGAGGASAAYELAGAGLDVVVLEAGRHFKPEDFNQRELDTVKRVYVDLGGQGTADGSIAVLQGSCIGGSTVVNGEVCFRTPDVVLEEWRDAYGVRDLSAAELRPIFEHVEKMVNVTPNDGRFLEGGRVPAAGIVKLGGTSKPIARNQKGCRGCAYCFSGCAWGCKQSMDQSYLPAALEKGARVISEARVDSLVIDGGVARGARARTPNGVIEARAKAVVLACGTIQTPLVLQDHGLGGSEVGKHLAVHPVVAPHGWYDEERPERPQTMLAMYSDDWTKDGYLLELGTGSAAFMATWVPGFGREHKQLVRELPKAWLCAAVIRDADAPGRVSRDKKGRKLIEYEMTPSTRETMRRALRTIAQIHFAAGAHKVTIPTMVPVVLRSEADLRVLDDLPLGKNDISIISYHPQGTARLGAVTDQDGAVKGVRGVYVMDASLFPTPVGVNPQISVMAVSTVLARRLAASLGR